MWGRGLYYKQIIRLHWHTTTVAKRRKALDKMRELAWSAAGLQRMKQGVFFEFLDLGFASRAPPTARTYSNVMSDEMLEHWERGKEGDKAWYGPPASNKLTVYVLDVFHKT